jgi:DNA-binding beta-propeller fold protein YncE
VAADAKGNVFVLDATTRTVTKLNSAGVAVARWGGQGTGNGVFMTPWSLVVAPNGNVFVDDRDALTVQQFQQLDLGPLTSAAANVTVKKGKTAKLKYKADEDFSSTVRVTIKVYKGSKLKATLKLGTVSQGVWHTKSWKCKLAKGSYKWKVYATDAAGHAQQNVASKTLKVK